MLLLVLFFAFHVLFCSVCFQVGLSVIILRNLNSLNCSFFSLDFKFPPPPQRWMMKLVPVL